MEVLQSRFETAMRWVWWISSAGLALAVPSLFIIVAKVAYSHSIPLFGTWAYSVASKFEFVNSLWNARLSAGYDRLATFGDWFAALLLPALFVALIVIQTIAGRFLNERKQSLQRVQQAQADAARGG